MAKVSVHTWFKIWFKIPASWSQHCTVISNSERLRTGSARTLPIILHFWRDIINIYIFLLLQVWVSSLGLLCCKSYHCLILVLLTATSASPKVQMAWVELSRQYAMLQEIYNPTVRSERLAFPISPNWASLNILASRTGPIYPWHTVFY
jgi:hypothetical protein